MYMLNTKYLCPFRKDILSDYEMEPFRIFRLLKIMHEVNSLKDSWKNIITLFLLEIIAFKNDLYKLYNHQFLIIIVKLEKHLKN